jgi:hypothetical protein
MKTSLEVAILRQLPYFVAVAEELNFQRASERLAIAQSALSRRIRDLERDLGEVPLFVRHARGVRLTPSGNVNPRSQGSRQLTVAMGPPVPNVQPGANW